MSAMGKMQESTDSQFEQDGIEIVIENAEDNMEMNENREDVVIFPPKKSKPCENTPTTKKNNEKNTLKRCRAKSQGTSQKQCKLDFPSCRVCLGPGSGLHYGVNTCESCKSFFRRCLTRREEYKCHKNKECPVTSSARGNCSGCRYKRCLQVGMSREAAQLGRYTLTRRTRTIMQAKGEKHGIEVILPELSSTHKAGCDTANDTAMVESSQNQHKSDHQPCQVCLRPGSGLHYGVNTCQRCKSFFQSCLRQGEEYMCKKSNDCAITMSSQENCSACWYQKCLEVGMSKEKAQLGRYIGTKWTQATEEPGVEVILPEIQNTHKSQSSSRHYHAVVSGGPELMSVRLKPETGAELVVSPSVVVDVIPNVVEEQSTLEILMDLALIEKLMDAMAQIKPFGTITTEEQIHATLLEAYERYTTTSQVFGKMAPLPKDEYHAVLESTGIDVDGRQEFLRQSALSCQPVLHSYIAFANAVPGFSDLSLEDQCSLLKVSHFEVFLLLTYRGYDPHLQMILTETGKAYHIDQAADIFYSRNLIMSIFDVCKKIQSLELTKEETACLVAISVTFGDRCQLENPVMVDDIQQKMVKTFRSLLIRSRPGIASKFFTKCVDCFVTMRAVADQYLKEYDEICQDKLVQKEAPIWLAYITANNVKQVNDQA